MADGNDNGTPKTKLLLGLVTLLLAIATTLATPVGDALREWLFPTSATVHGLVLRAGQPLPRASLQLDGSLSAATDDQGEFYFEGVPKGIHQVKVLDDRDSPMLTKSFTILKGEEDKDLGSLSLNTEPVATAPSDRSAESNPVYAPEQRATVDRPVELEYQAIPIPVDQRTSTNNSHSIVVTTTGPPSSTNFIDRVTYYLHPTFDPSVVTSFSAADDFALRFTAWGQFELQAKVYFKDGQVQDLSKYLAF